MVGQRGRPELPREVRSTAEVDPPEHLVLDTSFVFAALNRTVDDHVQCAGFFQRAGELTLYFNRLLEVELRGAALRAGLEERHGRRWHGKVPDGRARAAAEPTVHEMMAAWDDLSGAFTTVTVEIGEVLNRVTFLMLSYGLHSYDAVHVATALHVDVPHLATRDRDFARIPADALTLYAPPSGLQRLRRERGGRFLGLRR